MAKKLVFLLFLGLFFFAYANDDDLITDAILRSDDKKLAEIIFYIDCSKKNIDVYRQQAKEVFEQSQKHCNFYFSISNGLRFLYGSGFLSLAGLAFVGARDLNNDKNFIREKSYPELSRLFDLFAMGFSAAGCSEIYKAISNHDAKMTRYKALAVKNYLERMI